ncbi:N-acetylmuramidase domain-containing protein [Rhizobium sp. 1AS11]|uniref:N-acetylmuramidase domain-containing protein n=1 Tax=Rhizobium acaciae TaxID=2989736 RepID=UPI002223427F|nr:N-acetylmuramidase domain-containing protein [Rhizobium acaciae]MCW1412223.1 N-acetylmuramidase domain-containing protein [Rhizobium acaciae]MCW1744238.1 N-acetylmuramidase domain-containing protein [Rhizobium acaciae]
MTDIIDELMNGGVRKRTAGGIEAIGKRLRCESATVTAIVDVESKGSGVDASGHVKVLFEKHRLYKQLPAGKRAAAVKAGLARKVWIAPKDGGYKEQPNNAAALALLVDAINWCRANGVDESAALKSASYGLGQVMGENYGLCGWPSVQAFVLDMCESEDKHVDAMMGFLVGSGLADEMREKDFDAIARVYNGSGQVKVYGAKMRAAYQKHAGEAPEIKSAVRAAGLRVGSSGYRVEALQKRLNEIGFAVRVDKDFGPTTRNAVMAFQASHGMTVDGVVGPETQAALDVAESQIPEARQNATVDDLRKQGSAIVNTADKQQAVGLFGTVTGGAVAVYKSGALDDVRGTADALQPFIDPLNSLLGLAAQYWWVAAIGGGFAVFWWARSAKQAKLDDYRTGRAV